MNFFTRVYFKLNELFSKLNKLFFKNNRISLEQSFSYSETPFHIVAKSFLDKGIWNLSPEKLEELCYIGSAIMIPSYSSDRENFGFIIPITKKRAGKSFRMNESELTYEAQQSLNDYVRGFNIFIDFQIHSVSVYENGDHLELRMVASKNPQIIDREEIANQKERKKRNFYRNNNQDND